MTVERPLRLATDLSPDRLGRLERTCTEAKEDPLSKLAHRVAKAIGPGPHLDFNAFMEVCQTNADKHGVKLTAKRKKLLQSELTETREDAARVIKSVHKPGKATPDPIHGLFESKLSSPLGRGAGVRAKQSSSSTSRTHFLSVIYLPDPLQRDFYAEMCREEGWSTRALQKKIASMLYERTAKRVMIDLMADHTELFKLFSDNPSFKKWLGDTIFGVTYQSAGQSETRVRQGL